MDFKKLCSDTCELVRKTGSAVLEERKSFKRSQVEIKGSHDFVTHVDRLAEKLLVEGLTKILPEAGFIAEEGTSTKEGKVYNWIIDPIDGTTNFIHGIPAFSISIALLENQQLVMGVVYEINADEMFYAWKNSPAYLNGKEIQVSQESNADLSLLATGFPYHDYNMVDPYLELLKHFMKTTSGIRRLGSAAVDLAYVACGRFEGFYEYGLNPWDVAGGAFIVKQAGGTVCDWKGGDDFIFGKTILADNSILHNNYLNSIRKFFG
ncbi:MAG: inositol monophosphatase [Crocinitomicaceae bacterium]|nr:inositol monophosphatase [Crocinitomicaceae bacterium]|tara:strand:- start:2200 stop:2991 length:792 start_codon:yes stop_codon:yes gene_type:complete